MKKNLVLILAVFAFSSCIKFNLFDDDKVPYYKFTEEDKSFFPTVYSKLNEERKYINEDGKILSTKTIRYDFAKERHGNLKYSIPPHFLDNFNVELSILNTNDSCNTIKISYHKTESGKVGSGVEFPSNRMPWCMSMYYTFELPQEKDSVVSVTINNKTYNYVIKFEHPHYPFIINDNLQIDKILYDLKEGIISFGDTKNGHQFKIIN